MNEHRGLRLFPFWLAVGLGLCAFFLYACLMPSPPSEPRILYFDKIEHAGSFVVMGSWFAALFPMRGGRVLLGLALFAAATELAQAASGYRDGDVLDWCADTLGLVIGIVLARWGLMNWLYGIDRFVATSRD